MKRRAIMLIGILIFILFAASDYSSDARLKFKMHAILNISYWQLNAQGRKVIDDTIEMMTKVKPDLKNTYSYTILPQDLDLSLEPMVSDEKLKINILVKNVSNKNIILFPTKYRNEGFCLNPPQDFCDKYKRNEIVIVPDYKIMFDGKPYKIIILKPGDTVTYFEQLFAYDNRNPLRISIYLGISDDYFNVSGSYTAYYEYKYYNSTLRTLSILGRKEKLSDDSYQSTIIKSMFAEE